MIRYLSARILPGGKPLSSIRGVDTGPDTSSGTEVCVGVSVGEASELPQEEQ
jgi:hypothetical protein